MAHHTKRWWIADGLRNHFLPSPGLRVCFPDPQPYFAARPVRHHIGRARLRDATARGRRAVGQRVRLPSAAGVTACLQADDSGLDHRSGGVGDGASEDSEHWGSLCNAWLCNQQDAKGWHHGPPPHMRLAGLQVRTHELILAPARLGKVAGMGRVFRLGFPAGPHHAEADGARPEFAEQAARRIARTAGVWRGYDAACCCRSGKRRRRRRWRPGGVTAGTKPGLPSPASSAPSAAGRRRAQAARRNLQHP